MVAHAVILHLLQVVLVCLEAARGAALRQWAVQQHLVRRGVADAKEVHAEEQRQQAEHEYLELVLVELQVERSGHHEQREAQQQTVEWGRLR